MKPNGLISGQSVVFELKDAVCPNLTETIRAIGPELRLTGNIVFFSDGCDRKEHFAVVEVPGVCAPLIVPVNCLGLAARTVEERPWSVREDSSRKAC